jgi:hypothetical protein
MTTLTHQRRPFDRALYLSKEKAGPVPAAAHLATIKRAGKFALAVLIVTGALAGIIALRVAIFVPHLNV